ncbi:MAG TPA: YciI family protein [Polyangiales bacterium]|nr:YciI family protein [Polyangiales bacterium]
MTTTKYLLLYRSPVGAPRSAPSPEAMQQAMQAWNAWKTKFQDEILDMGDGLTSVGAVCRSTVVTDGPYIESKEVIGGYMFVATSSLERAIQIAKEGPMTNEPGASVEIRALAGRAQKISST